MDLKIAGKVAVVAASSTGLGRAVAKALAAEGANLAICSRSEEKISEVAEYIRAVYEVDVLHGVCDVTDKESIEAFKTKVIDHFNTCHILFTNAGGPPAGKVLDFNGEDFRKAADLNLHSTIDLIYSFLPYMKNQNWGRILALTSVSIKQPIPTLVLSNVVRVGVAAFIKSLSNEVGQYNVTANTIAPGYFLTEHVKHLLENAAQKNNTSYQQEFEKITNATPVKNMGNPGDLGALCAFLASEHASYITGETHLIDGGMHKGLY
ncbi:MAG: SDR family oxidoreductase [bacterium]|nr:SDR family oxidoreductase [bacterium]